jgi:hypothetical protein
MCDLMQHRRDLGTTAIQKLGTHKRDRSALNIIRRFRFQDANAVRREGVSNFSGEREDILLHDTADGLRTLSTQ